jgi:propionyl-CoA carboxylase alpha chain
VHPVGDRVFVDSALGSTELAELPRFAEPSTAAEPGSLHAPMPGTVVRVEVAEGDPVSAGAVVVVLEAMKMEHAVRAPADGVVASLPAAVGETVTAGQVLAVVGAG